MFHQDVIGIRRMQCRITVLTQILNIFRMTAITTYSSIRFGEASLCSKTVFRSETADSPQFFFTALYKSLGIDYKKFYKMDCMSKLGFLASELALGQADKDTPKQDVSIILFNRSSSLETDTNFQKTIDDPDNFFPSPSEFVYTLPNIITGEIAIRNKIYGETSFYVSERFDSRLIYHTVTAAFTEGISRIITGWVEYYDKKYEAFLMVVDRNNPDGITFTSENINKLYD